MTEERITISNQNSQLCLCDYISIFKDMSPADRRAYHPSLLKRRRGANTRVSVKLPESHLKEPYTTKTTSENTGREE